MLENIIFAALAFDPSSSPHYRVVCFDYSESRPPVRLQVFSSETGNWTGHETPFGYSNKKCKVVKHCIYLDGALYCISTSKHIICFDLNRGNSRAIELPEKERLDPNGFGCVGQWRGHLCYSDLVGTAFNFWLLEDRCKNDRWTLVHNIDVDYLGKLWLQRDSMIAIGRFGKISSFRPFALHPTSDVIFFGTPGVMASYHLEDKRLKLIYRTKKDRLILMGQLMVFPYTPCLVNLKDFGG
nr:F-box protein At5g07610-like [Populus alba]